MILLGPFLVKSPIFLLHHWLPKAHVEAPTAGRIVLAGILLKVGVYGLIKILTVMKYSLHTVYFAAIIGSAVRALLASLSRETKVIIAYSSVTHINLVIYGLNIIRVCMIRGGYLISLRHGYVSALLFYSVGELYRLNGSRILYYNVGLLRFHGILICILALILIGNIRVPPMISFFGEVCLIPNIISYFYILIIVLLIYFVISFYYSIYLLIHLSKIGHSGVSSPLLIIELFLIGVFLLLNILPILL
jgi:NADH-ubiquinone oxidoreductase chain 4